MFTYARFSNGAGSSPVDTASAAINIAHNPGTNVTNLVNLASASGPFLPVLGSTPNDFMVGITYTGVGQSQSGGADGTYNLAIDAAGNIWGTNIGNNAVSELSNLGRSLSGSGGFINANQNTPVGIAIDLSGNAWSAQSGKQ